MSLESVWLEAFPPKALDQAEARSYLDDLSHGNVSSLKSNISDLDSLEMRLVSSVTVIWLREMSRYSSFSIPGMLGLAR